MTPTVSRSCRGAKREEGRWKYGKKKKYCNLDLDFPASDNNLFDGYALFVSLGRKREYLEKSKFKFNSYFY